MPQSVIPTFDLGNNRRVLPPTCCTINRRYITLNCPTERYVNLLEFISNKEDWRWVTGEPILYVFPIVDFNGKKEFTDEQMFVLSTADDYITYSCRNKGEPRMTHDGKRWRFEI